MHLGTPGMAVQELSSAWQPAAQFTVIILLGSGTTDPQETLPDHKAA